MDDLKFKIHEYVKIDRPGKRKGCLGWVSDCQQLDGRLYYAVCVVLGPNGKDRTYDPQVWIQENELQQITEKDKSRLDKFINTKG